MNQAFIVPSIVGPTILRTSESIDKYGRNNVGHMKEYEYPRCYETCTA